MGTFALIVFLFVTGLSLEVARRATSEVSDFGHQSLQATLAEVARSGLNIAKEALAQDTDWTDCDGANAFCTDADAFGYYPLNSLSLGARIENYFVSGMNLTVMIKPVSASRINVIVVARNPNNIERVILGARFDKLYAGERLPIMYGGASTNVVGGEVCSYYWDGTQVAGITLPNFSVYMDTNFYFSADVVIPPSPAGNNPKDVRFFTNFDTEVRVYDTIDRLYSTGDVTLLFGATVDYVEAGGQITTDAWSSCGTCIENSSWQYPSFNTTLADNALSPVPGGDLIVDCSAGSATVPAGNYDRIEIRGSGNCEVEVLGSFRANELVVSSLEGANSLRVALKVSPSAGEIEVGRFEVRGDNTVSIDPQGSPLRIRGDSLTIANYGDLICTDPRFCLFDFNDVSLSCYFRWWWWVIPCPNPSDTTLQGTVLARNSFNLRYSTTIGNVFAENLDTFEGRVCNIVDSTGAQILPDSSLGFFSLVTTDPSLLNPITSVIYQTICSDYDSCAGTL